MHGIPAFGRNKNRTRRGAQSKRDANLIFDVAQDESKQDILDTGCREPHRERDTTASSIYGNDSGHTTTKLLHAGEPVDRNHNMPTVDLLNTEPECRNRKNHEKHKMKEKRRKPQGLLQEKYNTTQVNFLWKSSNTSPNLHL